MRQGLANIILRLFLVLAIGLPFAAQSQQPDSLQKALIDSTKRADSIKVAIADSIKTFEADSVKLAKKAAADSAMLWLQMHPDTSLQAFYRLNTYIHPMAPLVFRNEITFAPKEKDRIFYLLAALLLALGAARLLFSKYFSDLFSIFFQTTFRQKSIREQLLQNRMASLVLNVFFCVSAGVFLYLAATYKGWLQHASFFQAVGLCIGLVAVVYASKFVTIQLSGWLFGMGEAAETYLFIVFLINKVMGVLLLPAILVLALGNPVVQSVFLVISLLLLGILFIYRYLIALPLVRSHSSVGGFHFFIYLCAFEIVPVMLIYKILLLVLNKY